MESKKINFLTKFSYYAIITKQISYRKEKTMVNLKKALLSVLTAATFALSLPLAVSADSAASVEGLNVSIRADKEEYEKDEDINITLNIRNTTAEAVSGININTVIPEGLKADNSSVLTASDVEIAAGEEKTVSVKLSSENGVETPATTPADNVFPVIDNSTHLFDVPVTSGPVTETVSDGETAQPEATTSEQTEAPADSETKTEETIPQESSPSDSGENNSGTPTGNGSNTPVDNGNDSGENNPGTGVGLNVALCAIFVVLAGFITLCIIKNRKNGKKWLGIFMCLILLAGTIPLNEFAVLSHADDVANSTPLVSATVSTEIKVDGQAYTIASTVSKPSNLLTVTFESNGGTPVSPQQIARNGYALVPANPRKDGFVFENWYSDSTLNTPYDFNAPVTSNITLYANWTEKISEAESDGSVSGGGSSVDVCSIVDFAIDRESGTAAAAVSATQNSVLVIAYMDEDAYFNRTSEVSVIRNVVGSKAVNEGADQELITVTLNYVLPEHFVGLAYLVDSNGEALCDPRSFIRYTTRFEEFDSLTVDDFEGKNVLNFDENNDTNFGVLADDVRILNAEEVERSEDGNTYIIHGLTDESFITEELETSVERTTAESSEETTTESVEENIAESVEEATVESVEEVTVAIEAALPVLAANDKVYIIDEDGDEFLFKVGTAEVGENNAITATAVRADDEENGYSLRDFYTTLKVEDLGIEAEEQSTTVSTQSMGRFAGSAEVALAFDVGFETDHFKLSGKVEGSVEGSVTIIWDIHIFSPSYFEFEVKYTVKTETKCEVAAKTGSEEEEVTDRTEKTISMGKIRIPIGVTGLDAFADLQAKVKWEISAGITLTETSETTHGFSYNTIDGSNKIDKKSYDFTAEVKGKAEIEFGPAPSLGIEFLGGVVSANLECFIGGKIEAEAVIPIASAGDKTHGCRLCIDGEVKFVIEVSAKLKYDLGIIKGTPVDYTIVKLEKPVFDFYLSLINDADSLYGGHIKAGRGDCENFKYKIGFNALNADGNAVTVEVAVSKVSEPGNVLTTVNSGSSTYLYPGNYVAKANIGGVDCQADFAVDDSAKLVRISANNQNSYVTGSVVDSITKDPIANVKVEVYSGNTVITTAYTGTDGRYRLALDEGSYKLAVTKENYITANKHINITYNQTTDLGALDLVQENKDQLMGGIYGYINNAKFYEAVADVDIKVTRGWDNDSENAEVVASATTDDSGYYDLKQRLVYDVSFGLNAGNYTVIISKDGFISTSFNVTVSGGTDIRFDSTITPVGSENEYYIVLTWGEEPHDLDSHLNGVIPNPENGNELERDHIFFSRQDGIGAFLDVDDVTSYGPETITIADIDLYEGNIMYSVHDYTNRASDESDALSRSGAVVKVYKGSQMISQFNVPAGNDGTVWNVFYFDSNRNIVPVNTFEYVENPLDVGGQDENNSIISAYSVECYVEEVYASKSAA